MKKHIYFRALMIFFIMLFPGLTYAANRYVNGTTGSDLTGDGTLALPWQTIQKAVTSSIAGDVINVAAGTYTETGQIDLNKNLTLIGAAAATTIIKPSVPSAVGGNVKAASFIYIDETATVIFKKFTVDCDGKQINHAIQSRGTLTVDDCIIKNVQYTGFDGRGIVLFKGTGTISNTTLINIGRIGIHVRGNVESPNPIGTIQNVTYTGKGVGDWLDYGVEFGGGGTGTVTALTCSDCKGVALSDGSTSAAVLVTDYWGTGTNATISNSILTNNSCGIAVGYAVTDGSIAVAHNNDLSSNTDFGIDNVGTVAVNATCNWWGSNVAATVAAKKSGLVNQSPFLGDGTDGSTDPGFQPAASCQGPCLAPPAYHGLLNLAVVDTWYTDSKSVVAQSCYVYKIAVTKNKEYTFKTGCGNGASADFDTYLELYDHEGVWITGNDDGCAVPANHDYTSKIIWLAATTADVYVKVRGYNAESHGDFTIACKYSAAPPVLCKTPPDHDGVGEVVVPVSTGPWGTISSSIVSGECKIYEFEVVSGNQYTFKTGCTDGVANFDTYLELYNATGVWQMGNDDGCAVPASGDYSSKIIWTAGYTGHAYVKVRGYNSEKFGTFTLAYSYSATPAGVAVCKTPEVGVVPDFTIAPVVDGPYVTAAAATIVSDACILYKVTGITSGKAYTFKTGCATGAPDLATANFDTYIGLYNSEGTFLTGNDDGCAVPASNDYSSKVEWVANYGTGLVTDVAYVKVRGYNSYKFGTFRMAYVASSTGSGSVCKTPPADFDEVIAPDVTYKTMPLLPGDPAIVVASDGCKVYKVTGINSGSQYTFKTGCGDGAAATFDTYLELYNAAGVLITSDDDGCKDPSVGDYSSKIIWTATYGTGLVTDVAFIKVRGYNSSKFGTFRLAYKYGVPAPVTCNTPPVFDVALTVDPAWKTNLASAITIGSDACIVYKFSATPGTKYTFKTGCGDGATANFDTYLELYNNIGTWIIANDDGCAVPGTTDYSSKIEWTAPANYPVGGDAFIKVRGYNSSKFGTYTLAYSSYTPQCAVPPTSSNVTITAGLTMKTANAEVTSDGCYVFKVEQIKTGDSYTFQTGCDPTALKEFDTFMVLMNGDGAWLKEDDDGCAIPSCGDYNSKIVWTATYGTGLVTDIAFVKVRGWNASSYGHFKLFYKYVAGMKDATAGTGDTQSTESKVKVYPNPASQSFNIACQAPLTFTRFTLSELTGRVVMNRSLDKSVTSTQIESTDLAPGVYVLSIETSEGWIRKKVSIVR